jgi:hypothetical protein
MAPRIVCELMKHPVAGAKQTVEEEELPNYGCQILDLFFVSRLTYNPHDNSNRNGRNANKSKEYIFVDQNLTTLDRTNRSEILCSLARSATACARNQSHN